MDLEFVQLLQDMIGDLEGAAEPIEVKIFGDDPDVLDRVAEEIEPRLEKVRGVVDLVGPERGSPEVTWEIDPAAAGRLGLTVEQVSRQLAAAWLGETATDLRLLDRSIPVRVRYPDADRFDAAHLAGIPVRGPSGLAPLAALGLEIGGQYESQRQAFRELLTVFGVAASLVLIILVVQFRAFTPALLILSAAPLSLGGAFALLALTGTELNVSSAMGLILLVGLAVKNGIVMLDYAHRLHAEGTPFPEAVAAAARVRLRPILMTTLCTLLGLLPLALGLGAGAELQKPLALAVIGGLGLSTLVTLYAVPAVYAAIGRR
jgi:multidrug efflux pump subunit AcrB